MTALAGYQGKISGQTGAPVAFTHLSMSDTGTSRITYRIDDTARRVWDSGQPVAVEISTDGGTTWVAAPANTVQYLGGLVTFAVALAAGTQVRVSASAYPLAQFAGFTDWQLDGEVAMLEDTQLGGDGSKTFTPGLLSGTVSGDGFWQDSYFTDKVLTRGVAVLSLYVDATRHYDMLTYVNKISVKDAVGGLLEEKRTFQISGSFYYNVG